MSATQGRHLSRSARTRRACGSTAGSAAAIPICRRPISTRSCARAKSASTASGWRSRPGWKPGRACACRRCSLRRRAEPGAAARRPIPPTPRRCATMILFEDRDVLVLNKPYGLAVQGGSGTKRHIDGMLAALADKQRRAAGAGASARPRHFRRAADAPSRARWPPNSARRSARAAPKDLLGAGRGRPEAGAGAHLDVPRQGRGHGRRARRRRAIAPISSACASPATAIPTRSIR